MNIGQRRSMINLCQWWKFLHNIVMCIIYYGICWSHVHMVLDFGIMGFGSVICKTVQVPGTGIKSYFNTSLLIATDTNIIIHIQRNMVLWILCLNLDVSMHSSASFAPLSLKLWTLPLPYVCTFAPLSEQHWPFVPFHGHIQVCTFTPLSLQLWPFAPLSLYLSNIHTS